MILIFDIESCCMILIQFVHDFYPWGFREFCGGCRSIFSNLSGQIGQLALWKKKTENINAFQQQP
jgi:hypothetical protein